MRTIPNWCHNTLTVKGDPDELARFVEAAAPSDALVRGWWKKARTARFDPEKRTFKAYLASVRESMPLSFDALVPQPTPEEYAVMDEAVKETCDMCAGHGTLPDTQAEASDRGAKWYDWMDPAEREDRSCNVCGGDGRRIPFGEETWYTWRLANWGTKWDASFDGPFLALGSADMDVDVSVAAQGGTLTPTVAIYKFDTAWSPPVPVVEVASEDFPTLLFILRYADPGTDFAGEFRCIGGVGEEDELEVEDVLAPEEMWF